MHNPFRQLALMAVALVGTGATCAADLPQFSTSGTDNPARYYVQFTTNGSIIRDMGAGQPARNRMATDDDAGATGQLWTFTGTATSCVLTSDLGNHLLYDSANNRFTTSATEQTELEIVATDSGQCELQIADKNLAPASGSVALVMNGGSGLDKVIDLWKHNFGACALTFVEAGAMDFTTQAAPAAVPEVSITPCETAPGTPLTMWYKAPATNWVTEALPIGGGDFGAMVFGGIAQDHLQFNHKTLWRGSARTGDLGTYLNFGDLYIINSDLADASAYSRSLDLNKAVATVAYEQNGAGITRQYIASYPDKVIALHMTASAPGAINLEFRLINAQGNRATYTSTGATFSGTLDNSMNYACAMEIDQQGGTASATKSGIKVEGADELTVYLACNTDFDPTAANHLTGDGEAVKAAVAATAAAARAKGWDALLADHTADHSALFSRVQMALDGTASVNHTVTELLNKQSAKSYARALDLLVFQYGRYLTIASSRGVALPSNLQGLWCKDGSATSQAVWASDIHANINVQMNYWPAEPTNLSECHMPFLDFIRNEATRADGTWQKNARDLNVSKGWVVNTAGNIFGGSSTYKVGKYSVANAWFCEHLWQHYTYTRDQDFLLTTAWPLMQSACEFWFERLTDAQNGDGTLECPNEYSPEQGRVQNATAHSQQLVAQLFINTLLAAAEPGIDADPAFIATLTDRLSRLDRGLRIAPDGLLREWKYQENTPNLNADSNHFADDEANVWQCHRHTSHLMGLYPGFEIDPGKDADIFNAAVKSLADRGDVATGWARAWRIALWSRARDRESAYRTLRGFAHRTTATSYDWHGGLYDNLLDAHATSVFQIEGNFGATAGMAEMLLQSRPDSLVLLPALPAEWPVGIITGLRAIGNFEVDLAWNNSKLVSATVTSGSGLPLTLAYPGIDKARVSSDAAVSADSSTPDRLTLSTEAGATYTIELPDDDSGIREISATDPQVPEITVSNRRIYASTPGEPEVYDLTGARHNAGQSLEPGFYVVRSGSAASRVVRVAPDAASE